MRRIINFASKMKWLCLLGLLMFFSDWPVWRWLWMFWLFGVVEILLTLPVFVQSLRQIAGIVIVHIKNRPVPDKDNFIPQIKYSLPFQGAWVAVNGGVTKAFFHSWGMGSQRYAKNAPYTYSSVHSDKTREHRCPITHVHFDLSNHGG